MPVLDLITIDIGQWAIMIRAESATHSYVYVVLCIEKCFKHNNLLTRKNNTQTGIIEKKM